MRTHNKEDRTSNSLKVEHCHWNHILRTSYGSGSHLRADSQVKDSYCAAHFHSLTPGQGHFFPLKLYNCDLFASWDQKCSKITFFFCQAPKSPRFRRSLLTGWATANLLLASVPGSKRVWLFWGLTTGWRRGGGVAKQGAKTLPLLTLQTTTTQKNIFNCPLTQCMTACDTPMKRKC